MSQIKDDLQAALDHLAEVGHSMGHNIYADMDHPETSPCTLVGALSFVTAHAASPQRFQNVVAALRKVTGWRNLGDWNDQLPHPHWKLPPATRALDRRALDECLSVLTAAIKRA